MFWYQRLSAKLAATAMFAVGIPLVVVAAFAADQAFSQQTILSAALLLTLFVAALVFAAAKFLTAPLDAAVQQAEHIAAGKIDETLRVSGSGETAALARQLNKINEYLGEIAHVADRIAAGNTNVEIYPSSLEDRLGNSFKNMATRTLRLVQTQDERDRLQSSIMKLLEEVADVASGDLTAEAEVTADATGAIADAFNYMIAELRGIIGAVKQTSLQVDASASEMRTATESLMRRSENQSTELLELSGALEKMASAMQIVAEETNVSALVSDNALTNAKQGAAAIQNNIQAMSRLRNRVQETAERIKRLGERSLEISQIVKIINDLAQRTSVLALNASIQANAAGPAGRGFVAVAEEVERLAERSAHASKQIDVLTKAIQGETIEAVEAMETTVKEVAAGVRLTGEVGERLGEIEIVTVRLAGISQEIAGAARERAQDSAELSAQMRQVASSSHSTAAEVKESAENMVQLQVWAQELRSSVASFRLPEVAAAEPEIHRAADSPAARHTGALPVLVS